MRAELGCPEGHFLKVKKLYTLKKWKEYSRRRQVDEEKRRKRRRRRGIFSRSMYRRPIYHTRRRRKVTAPSNFSFINNTEEMIQFFDEIREQFRKGHDVFIDLASVTQMTSDAVAVLLSKMNDDRFSFGGYIGGNAPLDEQAKKVFVESGFFNFVRSGYKHPQDGKGKISKRTEKRVVPQTAKELIAFATTKLYGQHRVSFGVYRALLESMANTRNHAAKRAIRDVEHETWWATVYFNDREQKAQFTFVDNGVGIFRSIRMKIYIKALMLLPGYDHAIVLSDVLKGKIGSRTGLSYRGKGLPSIYRAMKAGLIDNLVVVTNDVRADVSADKFTVLGRPFYGTLLYWEIGQHDDQEGEPNE